MCSLSSYKQRERRECGYSRRFYRLNVYTTNLYPPTGNLDSKSSRAVIEAFGSAREKMQATIFMVTHDSFAASFCDRVILFKDGVIYRQLENSRNGSIQSGSAQAGNRKSRREFQDELLSVIKEMSE